MQIEQKFKTANEIGSALGISGRLVLSLARRRAIPSIRLGYRTVVFDQGKVELALANFEIKAVGRGCK